MSAFDAQLLQEIRARFHHVERCPYQGPRIFFENAGGSLTLKSVVEVAAKLAAIPDNQGRDNPASAEMGRLIARGRADMATFLGVGGDGDGDGDGDAPPRHPRSPLSGGGDAPPRHPRSPLSGGGDGDPGDGVIFVGESGTECLFRVIRAAVLAAAARDRGRGRDGEHGKKWQVLGSTLEHPATASAARRWAAHVGARYTAVAHDPRTGSVDAAAYRARLGDGFADTRVATVIHTSPVSGMAVDVAAVAAEIRAASPECFIIVDGIQHAPHGGVAAAGIDADAYAVSGYKVFSRHNYGFAWLSPRLSRAPHEHLDGTADDFWELGTRDAAAYASFSAVVDYLDWLGGQVDAAAASRRARIVAAGRAIAAHEKHLVDCMLNGGGGRRGLATMPGVTVIGGAANPRREGLVSLAVDGAPAATVVRQLGDRGVRVHTRKNDYFSANILDPLGLETCVRVSLAHYNSADEVAVFLRAMEAITATAAA
ncbi:MAG: aminotransferase class V-fold PLP-dependent enzyme [Gammaproteobacteria bacterium]|nr:aminotransferase class V-fold PLP-dependent enzyme [Gammaproteobacteria bacterium]